MKVVYYAVRDFEEWEAGDLIPAAADWAGLPGLLRNQMVAPVLVSLLPQAAQDALADWEAQRDATVLSLRMDDAGDVSAVSTPAADAVPDGDGDDQVAGDDTEEDDDTTHDDESSAYEGWTKAELNIELDDRKIEHNARAKNAELVGLLEADDAAQEEPATNTP